VLDAGWFYDPSYQWGHASSPVIYKDLVIVQADVYEGSFIAAWKLAAGQSIPPPHRVAITPDTTDLIALPASFSGYLIERHRRPAGDR